MKKRSASSKGRYISVELHDVIQGHSQALQVARSDLNDVMESLSEARPQDREIQTPDPHMGTIEPSGASILDSRLGRLEKALLAHEAAVQATGSDQDLSARMRRSRHKNRKSRLPTSKRSNKSRMERRHSKRDKSHELTTSSGEHQDTDTSTDESSSDTDSEQTARIGIQKSRFRRRKGAKHPGLKELRATNPLYERLMSYRYYRLRDRSHRRTGRETGKVKDCIKRLEVSLKAHAFDGKDQIRVFDFLRRFADECDILEMTEAQAYIALPYFLKGFAYEQYHSVCDSLSSEEGGVTCWPEAVNYLLRSYATATAIHEAILDLRDVRQKPDELEDDYSTRLNKACTRCGNVHSILEEITLFTDGLNPAIKPVVTQFREDNPQKTYLQLVQHAKSLGDAHRAGKPQQRREVKLLAPAARRPHKMLTMSSSQEFRDGSEDASRAGTDYDGLQLLDGGESSVPRLQLPSTAEYEEQETALAITPSGKTVYPNKIAYSDRNVTFGRPGWEMRRPSLRRPGGMGLICHSCYARRHVAPECRLTWTEFSEVVLNFAALNHDEKARVPTDSYRRAKVLCDLEQANVPTGREMRPPSGHKAETLDVTKGSPGQEN